MLRIPLLLLALLLGLIAHADPLPDSADALREQGIEEALGKIDPALVAPFKEARSALDRGDWATAESLLRTVVTGAPAFDHAARRLGNALGYQGKHAESRQWLERAVQLNRSPDNLSTLAYALAFQGNEKNPEPRLKQALALLSEARRLPGGEDAPLLSMSVQIHLQRDEFDAARADTALLEKRFPELMQTHYFAAVIATVDEHWLKAEREIKRAQELGLDEATVQRFLDSGVHSHARSWRIALIVCGVVGVWAAGLLLLFAAGFILSKITLRQADTADVSLTVTPGEKRLRRFYRWVLNAAGIYYYLSLPVVIVLVIGLFAAVLYGCLMIGRIPIQLMLVLGIGALVTIWSLVKSLFIKIKSEDPGRALTIEEAPELWLLTEDVARDMNTRPIDEIRLTLGTELAVYERGTWKEKMENKAKRVLIIGGAVLDGFKQDDFRAVLAHEYGHFSNRDTAGGDIAMRVQNDIMKFYYAMRDAGQATWLNVAFHFLRMYSFIFRRISHGATRLQEILADRVAAQTYGAPAFEGGLRHVIGQSIRFNTRANQEIEEALKTSRPLKNLYDASATTHPAFQEEFDKSLNRPTTEDDTHPGPMDRFRLISRIPQPARAPAGGLVWDLFSDRERIMNEMMATVEKNIFSERDEEWKKKVSTPEK